MTTRVGISRRRSIVVLGQGVGSVACLLLAACGAANQQASAATAASSSTVPSTTQSGSLSTAGAATPLTTAVSSASSATPSSVATASVSKAAGTLSVGLKGGTPPQLKVIDKTVADFQQAHPDLKVETVNFGSLNKSWLEAFAAQQAAGTLSDTFGIIEYNQGLVWAYQGIVQPIDAFVARDNTFHLDDYSKRPVDTYRLGGKLWGIPQAPNPVLIYYNSSYVETIQPQPPANDWNTDTFTKAVTQATTGTDKAVWGYFYSRRWSVFLGWLAAFGASMTSADRTKFTMNTSDALDALQYDVDLVYKYRTGPPPDAAAAKAAGFTVTKPADFTTGDVAYTLDGIASAPRYSQAIGKSFTWDVLPLPKGPKGQGSTLSADGWWIKQGTKQPEAAWELVKVMVGEDNERGQMTAALVYPSLKKLLPDYFKLTGVTNQAAVSLTVEQLGIPFPVTPSLTKWTTDLLTPALNDMWNQKKTPKEAMDGIASQVDVLLAADAKASKL